MKDINPALLAAMEAKNPTPIPPPPAIKISPNNGTIAIKTTLAAPEAQWFSFSPNGDARYVSDEDVDGWKDYPDGTVPESV
jgi:hypothetical protein